MYGYGDYGKFECCVGDEDWRDCEGEFGWFFDLVNYAIELTLLVDAMNFVHWLFLARIRFFVRLFTWVMRIFGRVWIRD